MPRPPVLPVLNWSEIFDSGVDFDQWLERAEFPDHRHRMQEAFAGLALDPYRATALASLPRTVHVVCIAEDWCGDVVKFVPVLMKVASAAAGKIKVRFITREQHPEVFIRFLTNGGEAIPKFVFLNEQFVECGNWGPMPAECRKLLSRGKGANNVTAARDRVRMMYESDPAFEAATRELTELIEISVCERP